jgi:hypothetical protein
MDTELNNLCLNIIIGYNKSNEMDKYIDFCFVFIESLSAIGKDIEKCLINECDKLEFFFGLCLHHYYDNRYNIQYNIKQFKKKLSIFNKYDSAYIIIKFFEYRNKMINICEQKKRLIMKREKIKSLF